jgi:hypothetical protein
MAMTVGRKSVGISVGIAGAESPAHPLATMATRSASARQVTLRLELFFRE